VTDCLRKEIERRTVVQEKKREENKKIKKDKEKKGNKEKRGLFKSLLISLSVNTYKRLK